MRKIFRIALKLIYGVVSRIFDKLGFYFLSKSIYVPVRKDSDSPIPDETELNSAIWKEDSRLPGVDTNDQLALSLLENLFPPYVKEFRESFSLHESSSDTGRFHLINGSFMAIDAHVYYAFIRHYKPGKIIEIGAGNSTVLAAAGGRRNLQEFGQLPHLIAIDPFPNPILKQVIFGLDKLIVDKVQNIGLEIFESLKSNDILFIDSSHILKSGGDVQMEYCEILPRLAPGVIVHVHDISLPKPYPRVYFDNQRYFNEQFLLQAFLSFNSRFEVIWAGNYMLLKYPEKVCAVFPEYYEMRKYFPNSEPTSFWIRVRQ